MKRTVRIADLQINPSYRSAHEAEALTRIKAQLGDDKSVAFGVDQITALPVLAERDGALYIVDGWARITAAASQGYTTIVAWVLPVSSEAEEAREYIRLNTMTKTL